MAIVKGQFEAANGDIMYGETSADQVKTSSNSTVQSELSALPTTYETIANAASVYATKTELETLRAGIITIVPYGQTKPVTGTEGIIYLEQTASGSTTYNQFAWENNAYVPLGSTSIDLSNYVTKLATSPAGSFGESDDKSLDYGDSFKVLQIVANADGQSTAIVERTITLPATDDTVGIPVIESNGSAPSNLASGALFFRKSAAV